MSNELSKLGSKEFDCESFVKRQISNLDDNGLKDLKSKLKDAHKQAQSDVHHILLSNHKSYLNLTEQLTAIEVEQMSISNIIQEVKNIFKSLDLEPLPVDSIDTNQLGSDLIEEIVDLEEVVGPINRKVLHISYYCYNLNGQYPDKRIYRLFVFTDMLVVVIRKKKGQHARTKEYVDSFIPLSKLAISSVDTEICLLNSELQKETKLRFERVKNKQDTHDAIKSILSTTQRSSKSHLRNNSSTVKAGLVPIQSMTSSQIAQFSDLMERLDESVQMRSFDQSSALYNEAKKLMSSLNKEPNNYRKLLQSKHKELSNMLLQQLNNQTNSKKHVVSYTKWLIAIGCGEVAADTFLKMRSSLIKKRARQIVYQGDVVNFISDLSFVLFSLIRNTGDWYTTSFKDAMMVSIYVKWARDEVSSYVSTCQRHLNSNQFGSLRKVAQTLYQIEHHAEILNKSGINITYIIHDLLGNHVVTNLREAKSNCAIFVGKSVVEDDLKCLNEDFSKNKELARSKSADTLVENMKGFTELASSTKHLIIRNESFIAIDTILEAFYHMCNKVVDSKQSESELQMIIQNTIYVHRFVIDNTLKDLSELDDFYSSFSESIKNRAIDGKSKIIHLTVNKYSLFLTAIVYKFSELDLGDDTSLNAAQLPSNNMANVVFKLKKFATALMEDSKEIISLVISAVWMEMMNDLYWLNNGKLRNLGVGGVELLMLDVQYLIRSFESLIDESIRRQGKHLMEKTIKNYYEKCKELKTQPKQVKQSEWFDKQVAVAISDAKTK
eukprot:NODE_393_length_9450_cov_0.506791.p2 type:complete len:778 gc:universal NODE_393_length_9450_cov_0.506791:2297-4630(+)